jgi:hypothetical protein
LILSGSSLLRPGLPFALLTPSYNYVTAVSLEENPLPHGLILTKYVYVPDLDALENQMLEVQALGSGALEEWYKGLEISGKIRQDDATRFELWEASMAAHVKVAPLPQEATQFSAQRPTGLPLAPSIFSDRFEKPASVRSPRRPTSPHGSQYSGYSTGRL